MNCKDCHWWSVDHGLHYLGGDCHHRSPVVTTRPGHMHPVWPPTDAEDYCGDFKPSLESQERITTNWATVGLDDTP